MLIYAFSCAGASSFGMSGVNAHALLACDLERSSKDGPKQAQLPWHKQRCWAAPAACTLLTSAIASAVLSEHIMSFSCRLGSAHLSYLWDHRLAPFLTFLRV